MSSQTRNSRGGGNGLDVRTLAIASFAAAVAAVIVSRIWTAGTPIAAAATPVIVTLLKELLDRPTAAIADRVTSDSAAVRDTRVWDTPTRGDRDAGGSREVTPPSEHRPGDVRVYRADAGGGGGSRIKPKVVLVTAIIAFVIAGVVITGGQVLAGNPFGKDGTGSIFLGEHKVGSKKKATTTETEPQQTQTVTEPSQTVTEPQQTTTQPNAQQQQEQRQATEQQRNLQRQQTTTTPTTPTETTPAP